MSNQENGNRQLMCRYIDYLCSSIRLLNGLEHFTQGIGGLIGSTMLVFGDNPEVAEGEWPELENFEGVCFYCEYDPPPLLVTYQDFFDNLKNTVERRIYDEDIEYQKQAKKYMEEIRMRYKLK